MICNVLKTDGNWKTKEFFPTGQKPISFELAALKTAINAEIKLLMNNCVQNIKCVWWESNGR